MAVRSISSSRPRKEGDTRWAQEYLLDPLNAVEAYQTAQTGGQYNNEIPTQHKTVSVEEYHAAASGLGRSGSLLRRSPKSKPNAEAQDGGTRIHRSTSIKDRLMRRFTDEGKDPDGRQRPSRPLNEVSNRDISRMGNVAPPRGPRILTASPTAPKIHDVLIEQDDNDDVQNQENRPVPRKPEDRWSNNPFRDALIEAENRENQSPPTSPTPSIQRSPTNPFRRVSENASPPHSSYRHRPHPPPQQRTMQRGDGPRLPNKRHSRHEAKPRPSGQRNSPADTIDHLDTSFGLFTFHHEGPYDATLSHRNRNPLKSPIQATRYGNEMALKATAPQDIENSLQFGRPLDGVALFPPGTKVANGEVLQYEEYDVNRKDGNFRRYPGIKYRDEDLKGKGIEGYDGDLADKQKKEDDKHRRGKSLDARAKIWDAAGSALNETSIRRNGSTAGRLEGAAARIKRTFSIKRREKKPEGSV
ncbi:hypothetical protein Dda_7620 [Drechslerella dactyloides]|uniref:Pal1 cell morphology protein n=1 Tax=Drechslerella dactyloides TaxID=74499 RepID=A0AAD6NFR1_DREDA|nr:hypothetical protein Dda_7620 [Drechslerella dactyloides]